MQQLNLSDVYKAPSASETAYSMGTLESIKDRVIARDRAQGEKDLMQGVDFTDPETAIQQTASVYAKTGNTQGFLGAMKDYAQIKREQAYDEKVKALETRNDMVNALKTKAAAHTAWVQGDTAGANQLLASVPGSVPYDKDAPSKITAQKYVNAQESFKLKDGTVKNPGSYLLSTDQFGNRVEALKAKDPAEIAAELAYAKMNYADGLKTAHEDAKREDKFGQAALTKQFIDDKNKLDALYAKTIQTGDKKGITPEQRDNIRKTAFASNKQSTDALVQAYKVRGMQFQDNAAQGGQKVLKYNPDTGMVE